MFGIFSIIFCVYCWASFFCSVDLVLALPKRPWARIPVSGGVREFVVRQCEGACLFHILMAVFVILLVYVSCGIWPVFVRA